MSGKKIELSNWTSEQIRNVIKSDEKFTIGFKLYALLLISLGMSTRQVQKLLNDEFSFKQISTWVHKFNEGGIDELYTKPKIGKVSKLSDTQKNEIRNIILNSLPSENGFEEPRWSAILVGKLILQKFGMEYQRAQIYNLIRMMGLPPEIMQAKANRLC